MEKTEITIDGEVYTIMTTDSGHVIKELKPTPEQTAALAAAAAKEASRAKLVEIDLASIRWLREWVAKQADAPAQVKDYEAQAISEREKLK